MLTNDDLLSNKMNPDKIKSEMCILNIEEIIGLQ